MAHFAEINDKNIVLRVLSVSNDLEHRGADFLAYDLGLGGTWVQTSYNNNFRKQYAGVGFTYDAVNDVFIAPQPYLSWTLDNDFNWQPPKPMPTEGRFYWSEQDLEWINATEL